MIERIAIWLLGLLVLCIVVPILIGELLFRKVTGRL